MFDAMNPLFNNSGDPEFNHGLQQNYYNNTTMGNEKTAATFL